MQPKIILFRCVGLIIISLLLIGYLNIPTIKKVLTGAMLIMAVFLISGSNDGCKSLRLFVETLTADITLTVFITVIVYGLVKTIPVFVEKSVRQYEEAKFKAEFKVWLRKNVEQNPEKFREENIKQILSDFMKIYKP